MHRYRLISVGTRLSVYRSHVVDLLIMDWLIVCTITTKWIVLSGTEGCKGYKDYFYHFKGFLLGCVYTTIMALLFSGIDYAVLRFLIWK